MSRWTRDQTLVALNLYCQLPFGKFHQNNPVIIEIAAKIERSPSSLAMKLSNFASLDPSFLATGRVGLKGASSLDRQVWEEFEENPEIVAEESQKLVDGLVSGESGLEEVASNFDVNGVSPDYSGRNTEVTVKARRRQGFFRRAVLSSYEGACCMTGVSDKRLLVASHIVPWSKSAASRLNPANGLCLSSLHDRAYDQGLITVAPDFSIKVSEAIKQQSGNKLIQDCLIGLEGKKISLPKKFIPNTEFLDYHEREIFLG